MFTNEMDIFWCQLKMISLNLKQISKNMQSHITNWIKWGKYSKLLFLGIIPNELIQESLQR